MSFRICFKNIINVAFLLNKIKIYIYSDPKNEDIVKILCYFVVFLDFFFNKIKLGESKFTILHTKSILIFSLLEAARALHVQPMLVYIYIYIYITETSETPTSFDVSIFYL